MVCSCPVPHPFLSPASSYVLGLVKGMVEGQQKCLRFCVVLWQEKTLSLFQADGPLMVLVGPNTQRAKFLLSAFLLGFLLSQGSYFSPLSET